MSECVVTMKGCLVKPTSDLFTGWVRCDDIDTLKTFGDVDLPVDVKEGISWNPDKKIPAELFKRVLGTVHHYPRMETGYVIYRNGMTNTWDIRAPEQKGSAAHVNFYEEEHPDHAYQLVGTIHTHPEMSAFWSGTDTNDQTKKPGTLHMVLGLRNGHVHMTLCTVFMKGAQYNVPFEEIVEPVDFGADYDPVPEWVGVIDRQSYVPPAPAVATYSPWQYGQGYGKHVGYGRHYDDLYGYGYDDDWDNYPCYGGQGKGHASSGGYKPSRAYGYATMKKKRVQLEKCATKPATAPATATAKANRPQEPAVTPMVLSGATEELLQSLESLLNACYTLCERGDVDEVINTAMGDSLRERADAVAEEDPIEALEAALEALVRQDDKVNDAGEALDLMAQYTAELEAMESLSSPSGANEVELEREDEI